MPPPPSASIGDVKIYPEDVATLEPGCWLNDAVLAYLLEAFRCRQGGQQRLVILEPTTAFTVIMVAHPGQLREMLGVSRAKDAVPLTQELLDADIVIMPLSNNEDAAEPGGGSHWSLLVFRRRGADGKPRFEHYDSCNDANAPSARSLMAAILPLLFAAGAQPPRTQLMRMTTPQQANGSDCGVYALAISEIVCAAPVNGGAAPSEAVTMAVRGLTPEAITTMRSKWLKELQAALAPAPND